LRKLLADWDDAPTWPSSSSALRQVYPGVLIYAGKYSADRARQAIAEGWADLIAFGRPFVASPDLSARIRAKAAWASHHRETLFGGDARGLTD
jgi:N-ethylmaleimide reductase